MEQSDLIAMAAATLGSQFEVESALAGGGSARRYYRLRSGRLTIVGVVARDRGEMRAFLAFTRHFQSQGIPVAEIYGADEGRGCYLMEDLGETTLCERLAEWQKGGQRVVALAALESAVRWLPQIQVRAGEGLDYSFCEGSQYLGAEAYGQDFELFVEEYVPRYATGLTPTLEVREQFRSLAHRLGRMQSAYFCYRDFQTRNIMWSKQGVRQGPIFIDYQSGCRGPLAYDLASILYSPDSGLIPSERDHLQSVYLEALSSQGVAVSREEFLTDFHALVLIRRLQALGAYARIERAKNTHAYREKIPPTLETLAALQREGRFEFGGAALQDWLARIFAGNPIP